LFIVVKVFVSFQIFRLLTLSKQGRTPNLLFAQSRVRAKRRKAADASGGF